MIPVLFMTFIIDTFLFPGSASVARGLSSYLDSLINNSMQNAFIEIAPINVPFLSEYFDFFSFVVTVVLAGMYF